MAKAHASRGLSVSMRGLLLSIFLMAGCGSIPQSERPTPLASVPQLLAESESEAAHLKTTLVTEQNAIAAIDERISIFFVLGSSTINQRERGKLRNIATILKSNKSLYVTLIGHANDNGSRSFNLAVADARVESVGAALKKIGVSPRQIKKNVIGGEQFPRACQSTECRRKMRRVELIVSS